MIIYKLFFDFYVQCNIISIFAFILYIGIPHTKIIKIFKNLNKTVVKLKTIRDYYIPYT